MLVHPHHFLRTLRLSSNGTNTAFLRPLPSITTTNDTLNTNHLRPLHSTTPRQPIPSPTPICPDAPTFLHLIGRSLFQKHASKIPSWESLFSLSSTQLRELGVEPARDRRYLLRWRERFRKGEFGFGGGLREVGKIPESEAPSKQEEGQTGKKKTGAAAGGGNQQPIRTMAEVRVVEVDAPRSVDGGANKSSSSATVNRSPGKHKVIVNVRPGEGGISGEDGAAGQGEQEREASRMPALPAHVDHVDESAIVRGGGLKIIGSHTITGPYVQPVKGSRGQVARIVIREGMWEHRRGHKVAGGERRKAEVRAKRQSEERRTTRG
ncbi:MAG: hypothetical protein M1837_001388 [Sclerophora amabilis]|nr:MAG: hypothetical protein M1837_001388 [Sclerophora amabilis]